MAETSTAPVTAEQLKTTAAFFSNVFNPGVSPLLKAQADLLVSFETTLSDWLRRRHDAVLDTQQLVDRLRTSSSPFEALKTQQEWVSRAFLRLAADTATYQSITERLVDSARTWSPQGAENLASKGAESTQGAESSQRTASAGAESAESQAAAAAAARATARPTRIAEKAG